MNPTADDNDERPVTFTLAMLDDGPGTMPRIIATAVGFPVEGQAGTVEDAVRALLRNYRRARKEGRL